MVDEEDTKRTEETRQAQREEAARWLDSKMRPDGFICPFCGTKSWTVTDIVQIPRIGEAISGRIIPVFGIICQNCGYTPLFHAITAGVESADPDETPDSAEPQADG